MKRSQWLTIALIVAVMAAPGRAADWNEAPSESDFKSTTTGLLAATFTPGLLLHGSGNYYAGSYVTGGLLTATEIAGLFFIVASAGGFADELGYEDNRERVQNIGLGLFLGSWAADILTTPLMVKRHNDRLRRNAPKLAPSLGRHKDTGTMTVGMMLTF